MCFDLFRRLDAQQKRIVALEQQLRIAVERARELEERKTQEQLLNGADDRLERLYECKLCMTLPISCVFLPCGHTLACQSCAQHVKTCPLCDSKIEDLTMIHLM